MERLLYPVHYFLPPSDSKTELRFFQRRDLGACIEIIVAMIRNGFDYGSSLLNFPPLERPPWSPDFTPPDDPAWKEMDLGFLVPGDLLIQTTRPPLDDVEQGCRKQVAAGYTTLERRLFRLWRQYFMLSSRLTMELARGLWRSFDEGYEDRRQMSLNEGPTAPYRLLAPTGRRKKGRPEDVPHGHTAGFVLRVDEAWRGGPGYLAVFGLDGISTALLAYRLRKDRSDLLDQRGFRVLEMHGPAIQPVPERPTDLSFATEWEIDVILEHEGFDPPSAKD